MRRKEKVVYTGRTLYHFLTSDIDKHYAAIKNELISEGVATSVTKTSAPLTQGWVIAGVLRGGRIRMTKLISTGIVLMRIL